MMTSDTAMAYAYARIKDNINPDDGGFAAPNATEELSYNNVENSYRYWQVAGEHASASRHTVLTAQQLKENPEDGYCVAKGEIELSPVSESSSYTIKSITLPGGVQLVDAAKTADEPAAWITSGEAIAGGEQAKIEANPLTTFGLYMQQGSGFSASGKKVISNNTAMSDGGNTIIGTQIEVAQPNSLPKIEFYLTYYNNGITVSRDLGAVEVVLERYNGGTLAETITMSVEIVTKAAALSEQSVDLYATQNGTYKGRLVIPAGAGRTLSLANVDTSGLGTGSRLVSLGSALKDHDITITMQPAKSQGWQSTGLMESAWDLSAPLADFRRFKTDWYNGQPI